MTKQKKVTGMNSADGIMALNALAKEPREGDYPINARCDKCGGDLRAGPTMLAIIRKGFVDHDRKTCGGVFRALEEVPND